MSFPAHYVGTYTGTGAALSVLDAGFTPSFLRIYNDSDNDVIFDYFSGQTAGLAVKQGAGAFVPAALTLVGSTPIFSGFAYYAAQTAAVTHVASPAGNPVYVKLLSDGSPYLCCNMATDTADKIVAMSDSAKILIKHDASAASGGLQVYLREDLDVLLINNTVFGADQFLRNQDGSIILLAHDASASSNGVALTYDDAGTPDRLEATFVDEANHNISTESDGWIVSVPTGSISQVTVTGNSAGSVSTGVSEVSSQGITLQDRGFSLGTDSSINESGKVYRYIALR